MTDESDKKGFGGLSSLASEVEEEVLPKKPASPATEQKPPPRPEPEKVASAPNEGASTQTAAPKPKPPSPPRTADQTPPPPPKGSSAVKWFWSIVGIGILIAIFNSGQDDRSRSGSRSTYSPSSSTPSTYTPSRTTPSLEFSKPPVGTNKVLSVSQIRWCLREDMRIEAKRTYANTDWEVDAFNAMVSDYNRRCGSFQYRRGTLERAKREVEGMRAQIVAEALGRSTTPSTPSVAVSPPSRSTGSQLSRPRVSSETASPSTTSQGAGRSALTYEVQTLLKQRGYNPGPVDGIYGGKTKAAIEQFERDVGVSPRGKVTEELRTLLKQRSTRRSSSSDTKSVVVGQSSGSSVQANSGDRAAIESTCGWRKNSRGPADYNECVKNELRELEALQSRPNLASVTSTERSAIENTCGWRRNSRGPDDYYKCVQGEIGKLSTVGNRPDLSRLSSSERSAIENTCGWRKNSRGPTDYYQCVEEQVRSLASYGKSPSLSGLNSHDRNAIESTCGWRKNSRGPSDYYACVEQQKAALERLTRRPDLSMVSYQNKSAIESTCGWRKNSRGPADYYQCIEQQLATLR